MKFLKTLLNSWYINQKSRFLQRLSRSSLLPAAAHWTQEPSRYGPSCHLRPAAHKPSHTSLHFTHHRCTIVDTLLVLSGTSAGQYVFLPLATECFLQTDHLSGVTVIHGCCFVCLCPWRRCRLIRLSPAHKITAASVSFLSPLLFYLFQSFT